MSARPSSPRPPRKEREGGRGANGTVRPAWARVACLSRCPRGRETGMGTLTGTPTRVGVRHYHCPMARITEARRSGLFACEQGRGRRCLLLFVSSILLLLVARPVLLFHAAGPRAYPGHPNAPQALTKGPLPAGLAHSGWPMACSAGG